MNKIFFLIFILIIGLYIGIGRIDPGVCNGPYKQKALHISVTKPILAGYWDIFLGFGNKHWDYYEEKSNTKSRECRVKGTDDVFGSDYEMGEYFDMECVWVKDSYIHRGGCAYYYKNDYRMEGDLFIDLTPWSKKVKDN